MDLEKLNGEYLKLKNNLQQKKSEISTIETNVNTLSDDKIIWNGKLIEAKRNNDKVAIKQATEKINEIDSKLKESQALLSQHKEEIQTLQANINDRIREIKENPELKKHLDEVMKKKYNRKLTKLGQEKDELVEKKDKLSNLKDLVANHPALGNNLKGILVAKKEIKKLKAELESLTTKTDTGSIVYTDENRANEIKNNLLPLAETKLSTNKAPLLAYISKKKLNITEKDIDDLSDKDFYVDEKGNIDPNTILSKNISSLNRQIKGYDKSIKDHSIALNGIVEKETLEEPQVQSVSNEPVNQNDVKWYQFIKRFKNWYAKRKQQTLPEVIDLEEPVNNDNNNDNTFKNSLKYEIVQEILKENQTQKLKDAKTKRKAEHTNEDEITR